MKLTRIISAFSVTLVCVVLAQAQTDRTFVSTHGSDNTDCGSSNLPCRNFSYALTKTNAGGEVIALDSGIYDPSDIIISQSVTLAAAPGAHVEIDRASSVGIQVTASTSDTVVLRNLYLSGKFGGGAITSGIQVSKVGTVHIENCVVSGFDRGISFLLNNAAQATIQDTIVRDCGTGMLVASAAGTVKVSIDHCRLQSSTVFGLEVGSHSRVTVSDSVAFGNSAAGFRVESGDLNLDRCEASNNDIGVEVFMSGSESSTATVSNSIVTNNK